MAASAPTQAPVVGPRYKWVVLSNTTVGVLLATLNTSSLLIALPVIFRGIHLDPLAPANFPYLLWMMMGYMLVTAAVVVTVGRIGDIFGRVKMYNLGFAWFTVASVLLAVVWSTGSTGALELVIFRMIQGVGGAFLFANSAAIITDAFPSEELGFALGTYQMAAIVGTFLGVLVGGLLSEVGWRWVSWRNVPVGAFGTVWAYLKLKEIGVRTEAHIDGRQYRVRCGSRHDPHRRHLRHQAIQASLTGWTDPFVLEMLFGGLTLLIIFVFIETKVRIRCSACRCSASGRSPLATWRSSSGRSGGAASSSC